MSTLSCSHDVSARVRIEHLTARVVEGAACTVHLAGELDLATRELIVLTCLRTENRSVVIDLAELTFMDCAGYGAVVEARLHLEGLGGSLTLVNPVGEPARLLELIDRLSDEQAGGTSA